MKHNKYHHEMFALFYFPMFASESERTWRSLEDNEERQPKKKRGSMSNRVLEFSEEGILEASRLLAEGKLVAFPTETVYGLGANALDEEACMSIFQAKGRPLTDPLIVHVADIERSAGLVDVTEEEDRVFKMLGNRFWPGPLTLIVRASSLIPSKVTAGTGFVGIRSPAHPVAKRLLTVSGLPLAAPSANRFGHVSPTRAEHVMSDLGSKDVWVLDGDTLDLSEDTCRHGIESTVVKIDAARSTLVILRQGAISREELKTCLDEGGVVWKTEVVTRAVKMHADGVTQDMAVPSSVTNVPVPDSATAVEKGEVAPGQAITHYAPDVPCFLYASDEEASGDGDDVNKSVMTAVEAKESLVVIDFGGQLMAFKDELCKAYRDMSPTGDAREAARDLFGVLRWAEIIPGAKVVLVASVVGVVDRPLGPGLADRIMRATSGRRMNITFK